MKTLFNSISRMFTGPSEAEQVEWMKIKFIPAFRRMIDAIDGRCTVARARRTVESLRVDGKAHLKAVPAPMLAAFEELCKVIQGGYSGNIDDVRDRAEEQLDMYFFDRQERGLHLS